MNIAEFRSIISAALQSEGMQELRATRGGPRLWTLPGDEEVVRFYWPQAHRRPWGFVCTGAIGIEIPALREWLREHKRQDELGIFHSHFVSYHLANDDRLGAFAAEHDMPIPADLWARLIKDRMLAIPTTLEALISAYRRKRDNLGWLAHPYMQDAWNFLLEWRDDPRPSLHVPRMQPDGSIG